MKQERINTVYQALYKLSSLRLPVAKAYGVYKLTKVFEEPFRFELSFEQELLNRYQGQLREDGEIYFPNAESAEKFQAEIQEANSMEVDLQFDVLDLSDVDLSECSITAADIMSLEGIVVFYK